MQKSQTCPEVPSGRPNPLCRNPANRQWTIRKLASRQGSNEKRTNSDCCIAAEKPTNQEPTHLGIREGLRIFTSEIA
jgi:hypothetical protein